MISLFEVFDRFMSKETRSVSYPVRPSVAISWLRTRLSFEMLYSVHLSERFRNIF